MTDPPPEVSPLPADRPADPPLDSAADGLFPVVGVGASAGGLEAFGQLLSHLPDDTGMAFVLVQHLDPKHESRLRDLLAKNTGMPLLEATQDLAVAPNHVYIIPPNTEMTLAGGVLHLAPRGVSPHLPIDRFLQSLAADRPSGALGVILSGTGSDGTLGLEAIKGTGGITFAQDDASAKYPSMPQSAVRSGCVDFVLPPEGIARELARVGRHPYLSPPTAGEVPPPAAEGDPFARILDLLCTALGVDFSTYRSGTIERRVLRRMVLSGRQDLAAYAELLAGDRAELVALYQDILINVTRFFREPEAFEALKTLVFPEILRRNPDLPIRIWVPGCSTGQEAYSLAIVLLEFLRGQPVHPPIQIFATDLSEAVALQRAREGIYPESIEGEVSAERLRLFFTKVDGKYRIGKAIRDLCIFARQNVATDPPFSRVDLISCRNLLIYFSPQLQKRVLPTFHFALNPNGFLFLGAAETVGGFTDLFAPVDPEHHIFSKKATVVRQYPHFVAAAAPAGAAGSRKAAVSNASAMDWQREADRVLLGQYAPAGVLVDDNLEILHFRGQTNPYLAPAPGEASLNVLKMAREGLFQELRAALDECRQQNVRVRRPGVRVRGDREIHEVDLQILPVTLPRTGGRCFLVLFEAAAAPAPATSASPATAGTDAEAARLRQELESTREYLQSIIEQQDAANEELKSANEEVLSSNEELQSTNEELETAKEEMQSVNEELTTVNEQLQYRNLELGRLNDYARAIVETLHEPFLVLDGEQLRVRSANRAFYKMFATTAEDTEGRLLQELGNRHWDIPELLPRRLAEIVTEKGSLQDFEVRLDLAAGGPRVVRLNARPILRQGGEPDLILLAIDDVTEHKRLEEDLRELATQTSEADQRKTEFLATLAHELRNPLAPILNSLYLIEHAENVEGVADKALEMARRHVWHMTRLIDDLLDISRITRGRIELRRETVELGKLVGEAVENCRPSLEREGHTLELHLDPEPQRLDADPVRLTQVVENLLSNAIKYSERGGHIEVLTRREKGEAVLTVRDAGLGIAPEVMPHIWDLFTQGDPSLERSQSGLGIGLTVVRSLVQLHGGSVLGRSAGLGKGSEFIVRLPLAVSAAAPESPAAPRLEPLSARSGGGRILVVDDNANQADSLGMLLKLWGYDVRVSYDGPSALLAAADFQPDVVFLDIGMPGMNGHEVGRRLRRDLHLDKTVLIALSGYGTAADLERSREAGLDSHLVKPVAPEALKAMLAELRCEVHPAAAV